jgi:hypothetical protein
LPAAVYSSFCDIFNSINRLARFVEEIANFEFIFFIDAELILIKRREFKHRADLLCEWGSLGVLHTDKWLIYLFYLLLKKEGHGKN